MTDTLTKPSNPKDAAAVHKLPLNVVPASLKVFAALAFVEGEAKYGGHNWRAAGVLSSVYKAAMERHMESWWNGEDNDPRTGTPHLASVIACAGIILDAELGGKLKDDRPPRVDYAGLIASLEPRVAAIREQFAGRNPKHYTAVSEAEDRQAVLDAGLDVAGGIEPIGGIDTSPSRYWRNNAFLSQTIIDQQIKLKAAAEAPKSKFKVGDRIRMKGWGAAYPVTKIVDGVPWLGYEMSAFPYAGDIDWIVEPKPFQIEAGKFYRTRDGRRRGPIKIDHTLKWPAFTAVVVDADRFDNEWRLDGTWSARGRDDKNDLVAEWSGE